MSIFHYFLIGLGLYAAWAIFLLYGTFFWRKDGKRVFTNETDFLD